MTIWNGRETFCVPILCLTIFSRILFGAFEAIIEAFLPTALSAMSVRVGLAIGQHCVKEKPTSLIQLPFIGNGSRISQTHKRKTGAFLTYALLIGSYI